MYEIGYKFARYILFATHHNESHSVFDRLNESFDTTDDVLGFINTSSLSPETTEVELLDRIEGVQVLLLYNPETELYRVG